MLQPLCADADQRMAILLGFTYGNVPFLKETDPVACHHGVESMSDCEYCTMLKLFPHNALDQGVSPLEIKKRNIHAKIWKV